VGVEIAVSQFEEVFRNALPTGAHAFLVNLADGTAIVHHNIKQSYQVHLCQIVCLGHNLFSQPSKEQQTLNSS
jgi:hypothetical protein